MARSRHDASQAAAIRPQRAPRRAGQGPQGIGRPYIIRNIPNYDILSEEGLIRIEETADRILAEIGIEFRDDPAARPLEAGRRTVDGVLVRFEPGMLREILKTAPAEFTQHARNPAHSVRIGGNNVVFSPAYGSPFVMDLDKGAATARSRISAIS
jgi:trimethylamine---corrinoid protein Co-methyltransferase